MAEATFGSFCALAIPFAPAAGAHNLAAGCIGFILCFLAFGDDHAVESAIAAFKLAFQCGSAFSGRHYAAIAGAAETTKRIVATKGASASALACL